MTKIGYKKGEFKGSYKGTVRIYTESGCYLYTIPSLINRLTKENAIQDAQILAATL